MSTVVAHSPARVTLPFRLRTALAVLLVCGVAATVVPRMRAAVRFFNTVSRAADYGLCMAGPMGAAALRDDSTRFRQLVRRRLVSADARSRPFAPCGRLAAELSGSTELGRDHELAAAEFLEWGAGNQKQSLNGLLRVVPELERMHAASWPFVRKPLAQLLRPARGAYQAEHVLELAQPVEQRGLMPSGGVFRSTVVTSRGYLLVLSNESTAWAFKSRDGGRNWTSTSVWQKDLAGHAHHCVGNGEGLRFALAPQARGESPSLTVGAVGAEETGERLTFGSPDDAVQRLACDESGAVLLTRRSVDQTQHVFACGTGTGCSEIGLPAVTQLNGVTIDVARAARINVIAWAKDGLVRVSTAKDRGGIDETRLVFDARGSNSTGLGATLEPMLVGFGKQLMLSLSSREKPASRWVLLADAPTAAFRAP